MDSDNSPISSLGPDEASQLLRDILNVGKSNSTSTAETSTASLATDMKNVMEDLQTAYVPETDESSSNGVNGISSSYTNLLSDADESSSNGMNAISSSYANLSAGEVPTKQQIVLQGNDTQNSFNVFGQDVTIVASSASALSQTTPGSNKVKISPVVNYEWEHRYNIGHLVSIHRNGLHVAYVLRGKSGGIVRVINRKTAERVLLKGFIGQVIDVAFAHLNTVVVGAVDEIGNMFIHEVTETDGKIGVNLLLQVNRPSGTSPSYNHRLIWCPYIPEEENSVEGNVEESTESAAEDASKLLVLTHNEVVEMWDVDMVSKEYGRWPLDASVVETGFMCIEHHSAAVIDAAYSPDGSALATASLDGEVKFFQVYLHDKSPSRCLHQWQPHNGQPVSSLFFLDDHKRPIPGVQFWKCAVTGAQHNTEIKIWSCETWSCLQTLNFTCPLPAHLSPTPCLIMSLDLSANYLVLSDIKRKVLYVLHIQHDEKTSNTHISSLSEFLLTQPCLSLAILDASRRRFKQSPDLQENEQESELTTGELKGEEDDEEVGENEQQEQNVGVLVRLFSVHTRALQELRIRYHPQAAMLSSSSFSDAETVSSSAALKDHLSEISDVDIMSSQCSAGEVPVSDSSSVADQPLLLTPDAFTSPRNSGVRSSGGSSHSSLTAVTAMDDGTPHLTQQPSPQSSITVTPSSSHDYKTEERPSTPPNSRIPQPDFTTSSPAAGSQSKDFTPPECDLNKEEPSMQASPRQKLPSSGSSSSASLEVSEILEGAKKSYEDEEEEIKEEIEENVEKEEEEEEETEEEDAEKPKYDTRIWPKAPVVPPDEDLGLEARMLAAEAIHRAAAAAGGSQTSNFESMQSSGEVKVEEEESELTSFDKSQQEEQKEAVAANSKMVDQLQTSMQNMLTLLQQQRTEIEQLQRQITEQRDQTNSMQTLQEHIENLEAVLSSKVTGALDQHSQTEAERMQRVLGERASQDQAKHDQLLTTLTRTLERTIGAKLDKTIRDEIRTVVLPAIAGMIEPLKTQLHTELAQKLTATDGLLRENIGKLVRSKNTIDSIGHSVGNAMQGPLQASCRDVLIPSFDRSCNQMFQQLNSGFQRGVHQYTEQLESHVEKVRRKHEEMRDPIVQQMQAMVEGIKTQEKQREAAFQQMKAVSGKLNSAVDQVNSTSAALESTMQNSMKSLEDRLQNRLRLIVQEEMGLALQNQQSALSDQLITAVRSGAMTPINHHPSRSTDPQQMKSLIVQLLQQGELNTAFQHALSASDLSLVIFVCETVNPSQVFDQTPCPLQQPVLLSLIQQLSANFQSDLELKLKYLQETLMNLDQSNSVTREHMPNVVNQLIQKLNTFLQSNPRHKLNRELRMLIMACKSLLK